MIAVSNALGNSKFSSAGDTIGVPAFVKERPLLSAASSSVESRDLMLADELISVPASPSEAKLEVSSSSSVIILAISSSSKRT